MLPNNIEHSGLHMERKVRSKPTPLESASEALRRGQNNSEAAALGSNGTPSVDVGDSARTMESPEVAATSSTSVTTNSSSNNGNQNGGGAYSTSSTATTAEVNTSAKEVKPASLGSEKMST